MHCIGFVFYASTVEILRIQHSLRLAIILKWGLKFHILLFGLNNYYRKVRISRNSLCLAWDWWCNVIALLLVRSFFVEWIIIIFTCYFLSWAFPFCFIDSIIHSHCLHSQQTIPLNYLKVTNSLHKAKAVILSYHIICPFTNCIQVTVWWRSDSDEFIRKHCFRLWLCSTKLQ